MNATEARALADKIVCDENDATYKKLKGLIKKAAENKEYSVLYGEALHPLVQGKLKEELFTVKVLSDQREGSYTTISW